MLPELPEHCPGSRQLPAGSVLTTTKNSKEEHGGRRSPEADMEREHVACGTIPAGEILAEPLTLFQARRSLKCSDPGAQASGQLSTARDPTRPLQERPCQPETGTGQRGEGPGLPGSSDVLIPQFVPAFHRSARLQGHRRSPRTLLAPDAAKAAQKRHSKVVGEGDSSQRRSCLEINTWYRKLGPAPRGGRTQPHRPGCSPAQMSLE